MSTQWKTTQRKKVCKRSLTLLKFSVICRQVLQALFKSFLASVTWQSKTRVKQDKRRSSRSSGPVDSISADQFTQFHIRRRALQPLARKLFTDVKVLQRLDTSMRGVPNIRWKIALSMQSVTKWYLHAGYMGEKNNPEAVLVFRVSVLIELWLVVIGCNRLSIKWKTNRESPRAGQ